MPAARFLTTQGHGDRAHRCTRGTSQADAGAEEGEFEDLVLGQLLKIGDFQNRHARLGKQIGVDDLPVLGIGRWSLLEAVIVRPDDPPALARNSAPSRLIPGGFGR